MFGYTKEEFTQLRVQELLPTEVAAELPHLVTEAKLHEGGVFLESLNRRKTGESFPVEVSIRGATIGGRRCVLVYVRDITARKKSEQEQKQLAEQLRQSQKMEAIGQLAGGLAHDFNNLLAAIRGSAEMLLLDPTFDSAVHQIARTIDKAAERGSELTQKLLGFARGGKTQNVPTDLNHIVREVMALLGRTIHKNIRLSQRLGVEKAAVMGDPGQLHQVLMNIAINARDAMPDGGDLSIETDLVSLDETFCRTHPGMTPKRHVHVRISDTGCGIPRENLERIFDPFFTTKPAGQGSGLGLTVVYGIVKTHSGCIEVQTRQGVGTTFHLYLPLAEGAEPAPAVPPPAAPVRGTGRILLVDDEEGVRTVAALILRKLGYEVAIAENGRVAVDYYRQHGTSVDLVVLDMVMPELDGQQCFRQLRKLNPAVKVILCTGFSTDARTQQTVKEGAISLIQKPFRIADFSLAVDQAMKMKPA
jgi:signal transduction histidine kinase/CheY-like chemotaxis protein